MPGGTLAATLMAPVPVLSVMPAGQVPLVAMVALPLAPRVACWPLTLSLAATLAIGVLAVPATAVPDSVTGLMTALTVTATDDDVQCASAAPVSGQVLSPPPETLTVLLMLVPAAAAVGVTGMAKLRVLPGAVAVSTVFEVQVTSCPLAVQPVGKVPMVRFVGMVSLTMMVPLLEAVPALVTARL